MSSRKRFDLDSALSRVRAEWQFVVATFAASGVGYLGSAGAPIIVQALIDSGLGTQQAGDLGTVELTMLAIASTVVTPFVTRVSHRKLAMGGAILAIIGLLISVMSVSYGAMLIGRVITGTGSGLAISGANAAVAARNDAERIFALIWTMGGGITAALAYGLPYVVTGGNYPMGFGILLVLCCAGLPFMVWVPPQPDLPEDRSTASEGEPSHEGADTTPSLYGPASIMALFGMFIYSVAEMALWNFGFYIPVQAGVPEEVIGAILGVTVLMGLAGGAFAAWLGTRMGRVGPIIVGSLLSVAGRWIFIASSTTEWVFFGGLLWGLGFYFVTPYQIGLVAALDRHGRLAVLAGGAMNFGYAVGPTIAGRVLEGRDASVFLVAIVGATLVSLFLLLPLAVRVDRMVKA
ncbi:MAG: MFS transporter [Myxococcales bacterium]|nr:MFS transporter [Myxococcales bacterium]